MKRKRNFKSLEGTRDYLFSRKNPHDEKSRGKTLGKRSSVVSFSARGIIFRRT